MRSQPVVNTGKGVQLAVAVALVLILLTLALIGPVSTWIYFGIIWIFPVGLATLDMAHHDSCCNPTDQEN